MKSHETKQMQGITKEIRQQKENLYVVTFPYHFIKYRKWYKKKYLFFNAKMDKNLRLHIFLTGDKPDVTAGLVYSKKIKLQFKHKNVKSPTITIPTFIIDYYKLHSKQANRPIFFTCFPSFVDDIDDDGAVFLEFE